MNDKSQRKRWLFLRLRFPQPCRPTLQVRKVEVSLYTTWSADERQAFAMLQCNYIHIFE
jgi:hypothetical protein